VDLPPPASTVPNPPPPGTVLVVPSPPPPTADTKLVTVVVSLVIDLNNFNETALLASLQTQFAGTGSGQTITISDYPGAFCGARSCQRTSVAA
jgi:hypothetical protein